MFLCLTGGCTDSSESTHVKMPHCWKSHVTAHLSVLFDFSRQPLHKNKKNGHAQPGDEEVFFVAGSNRNSLSSGIIFISFFSPCHLNTGRFTVIFVMHYRVITKFDANNNKVHI